MIKRLPIALLVLSAWIPVAGTAATGSDLLMKMNAAFSEEDYDGIFTYDAGSGLTSIRVVHKVVDGEQRERLVHLNGAPREILRRGEEVVCIVMPGDDLAVLENSIPSGPFARSFVREFERLGSSYSVEEMGEGRVAGRQARRIAVTPKDAHRYGFRLWLDADNHLLLRSQLVDPSGRKLEEFLFSTIVFGDSVHDSALESEEMNGSMVSHLTLKNANPEVIADRGEARVNWSVSWLPPGFKMASADIRRKPSGGQTVDSMIYSDGLATFSIFLERMPEKGAARMTARNGATLAVARGIMGPSKYFLATLVGEIPEQTGTRIVESISAE
ncbi:MAG: hypothetical protein GKR90_03165 [Pseudomonadales bacterium]|nr:hypothetical protein [Pseudomonadales bacterium]